MGEYISDIIVKLKPGINDPEGNTIAKALRQLGFDEVESVRFGKYYEVAIIAEDALAAGKITEAIGVSRAINTQPTMTLREIFTREATADEQT